MQSMEKNPKELTFANLNISEYSLSSSFQLHMNDLQISSPPKTHNVF